MGKFFCNNLDKKTPYVIVHHFLQKNLVKKSSLLKHFCTNLDNEKNFCYHWSFVLEITFATNLINK